MSIWPLSNDNVVNFSYLLENRQFKPYSHKPFMGKVAQFRLNKEPRPLYQEHYSTLNTFFI